MKWSIPLEIHDSVYISKDTVYYLAITRMRGTILVSFETYIGKVGALSFRKQSILKQKLQIFLDPQMITLQTYF